MANPVELDVSANELIKNSPEIIKIWLDEMIRVKPYFYEDFNWLGLSSVLTGDTNREIDKNNRERSLFLAELAVKTFVVISELEKEETHIDSNELSEMLVRARLINQFGDEKNHSLLDPHIIVKWFFERLDLTFEEAVKESKLIRKLFDGQSEMIDVEMLCRIRRIKNRLAVIEILYKNPKTEFDAELEKWLEIKTQLI